MRHPSRFAGNVLIRSNVFCGCTILLLSLTGCGNTCFVGVVNAPNSGVLVVGGNPPPACSLNQPMAAVRVSAVLASRCTNCSNTLQPASEPVLISGIELHPGAVADENSPEWQEVAPELAQQPKRVDLVEASASNGSVALLDVNGKIATGKYYQLRLRLAEASSSSQRYIAVQIAAPLEIRAGQSNQLHIELRPDWAMKNPSAGVVDFVPVLGGRVVNETSGGEDLP
jgi:hypothetical protein